METADPFLLLSGALINFPVKTIEQYLLPLSPGLGPAISYLNRLWISTVYTATFQPMGDILRLQRHWHIAEIPVACRETSIHYDINGLQVKEFLLM
jgi:hypothetical protein